jgi:TonB family protein
MNGLVPQKWHEVFGKVLAKRPDDRYQTATDFVQDLEYCLGAWFGSAMGDDTLDELTQGRGVAAAAAAGPVAAAAPAPPAPDEDVTTALPAPVMAPPPPVPPVPPPPPAPEPVPATVLMKPPSTEPATVLMSAPGTPPAPAVESTVLMGAPPPAPPRDGRGVPPPPTPGNESTVLMGAVGALPAPAPPKPPRAEPRPPKPPGAAARQGTASAAPSAPAPARASGSRTGLILGGLGLLLFAALAVGALMMIRGMRGSDTPAPTAAPQGSLAPAPRDITPPPPVVSVGNLRVESTPPGATVTVDGQARGITPTDVGDLTLGSHEVKVELRGYAAHVQTVELAGGAPRANLNVTLTRAGAETGAAEVMSTPAGATVVLDGAPVGQTPFSSPRLKAGAHRVELTRAGYETWTGTLNVQAGKRARIDASLRPAAAPAVPSPEPVDTNRIYVNSPVEVDTVARKSSGSSASYPSDRAPRLRSGDAVSVRVSFVVTEAGEVTDVKVVESGGQAVDDAVVRAVRGWKYSPAVKAGQKVKVRVEFRQTFRAG